MFLKITCNTHNGAPQVPAGDELHWFKRDRTYPGIYELDFGDLYCTGGEGAHEIAVVIYDINGEWLSYAGDAVPIGTDTTGRTRPEPLDITVLDGPRNLNPAEDPNPL
jgi:hypothetical protein